MLVVLFEGNGRSAKIEQMGEYNWIVGFGLGDEQMRSVTEKYRHMAFSKALNWIDKGK